MKKLMIPALVAMTALYAGGALAATVTHTVKSMDATAHSVTLDDGQTYHFPASYDLKDVKVGEKVEITFETKAGKHEATMLKAAK